MRIPTPLNYPGSKAWLVRKMLLSTPRDITEFISPFLGGAVIELNIAQRGVKTFGYDADPKLINFWQHWLTDAEAVHNKTIELISKSTKSELSKIKRELQTLEKANNINQAAQFYAINRLSFSGLAVRNKSIKDFKTKRGIIIREDERAYLFPIGITKIVRSKYARLPIEVDTADFGESINRHPEAFIYCDPPYFGKENLYGLDEFEHTRLREMLDDKPNWIVSYQDVPEARQLYKGFKILTLKMRSTFRVNGKNPKKQELLIFSKALAKRLNL